MSKEQKMARIEELKTLRFILSCKDRWNSTDYNKDREWRTELFSLEKEVA